MKWSKLPVYILTTVLALNTPVQVKAEEVNNKSFVFAPVFPDNQIPGKRGYFNLDVSPGQTQTVYVQIKNNTATQLFYDIREGNAFTTQNGGIQYSIGKGSETTHLIDDKFLLDNYVEMPAEIVVKPYSEYKVPIKIKAPVGNEGSYLGAILFKTKDNKTTEKQAKSIQVKQEVYFGIGIQLNLSKPDNNYTIEFDKANIKFLPSGTQVYIKTRNKEAEVVKGLTGNYKVLDEGKLLFEGKIKEFDMAPMSEVQYAFNWDDNTISNKEYEIHLDLTDGKEHFTYSNKVKVDRAEFEKYQNTEKNKQNNPIPQSTSNNLTLYVVIVVLSGMIFFLLFKRRKEDRVNEDYKE